MSMVRTALGAALAVCLASACSDNASPLDEKDDVDPADPGAGTDADPDDNPGGAGTGGGRLVRGLIRGGQLHQAALAAPLGASPDRGILLRAVEGDVRGRLGPLDPDDFAVRRDTRVAAPAGGTLRHVDLVQLIGGVPVDGTHFQLTVREDGSTAKVVGSSFRLYRGGRVDTTPAVDRETAAGLARQSFRREINAPLVRQDLQIRELSGVLELVWSTDVHGSHDRAFVIASGPRAGRVVRVDGRIYEVDVAGTVSGFSVTGGAPGGLGTVASGQLSNLRVTTDSGLEVATDANGAFGIIVPDGDVLNAGLNGRASIGVNLAGANLTASAAAAPTLGLVLGSDGSDEFELAQVTAYVQTDATRTFLEANGLDPEALGEPLTTNTNLFDVCNAFYGPDRSINFYQSGGGCNNSATDSIVAHEYGHFADDMLGGILDGGLSEGWGDLLSCYRLGIPEVGFDLLPGEAIRNCENDYVFPPAGDDEPHNLGQAWMGFAWRVRQGLIARYGEVDGEALARALVLPSLWSNAADIPHAVREVFLRDDDDGDLSNRTPNWEVLFTAAVHHGVESALTLDVTAPAPVTDLAVETVGVSSVTLTWTAPGDDENEGTAASYEVRYSTQPITPDKFATASLARNPPPPGPAGTRQTMVVTAPPSATLFFALVARDEAFNTSALSNVIQATTEAGTVIYQEGAENGLGGYTATGLWHVTATRASEGVQSFWYGQEETGNYDTGDTNSGTLTSPPIDLGPAANPVLAFAQFAEIEEGLQYDVASVIVTDADDPTNAQRFPKDTANTGGTFVFRTLPLAAFAGRRITLTFSFDTVDPIGNETTGWLVDDIRIVDSGETCARNVCETGAPLEAGCSACATTVCSVDPFCCEVFWDRGCVQEAEDLCGETCAGCSHDQCAQGDPLESDCDPCTEIVCSVDPFCCTDAWDGRCVTEATQFCALACEQCSHDLCQAGGPLTASCDPCVEAICSTDSYCCFNAWDDRCVAAVTEVCGLSCETTR